ncbi:MAG: ABC transporter ATP-binding protein [Thermoguttaceae bacterium]
MSLKPADGYRCGSRPSPESNVPPDAKPTVGGTVASPLLHHAPGHVAAKQLIQLHDVCKTYQVGEVEVHALRGVSLGIERGEYVSLIGPSGSGKTTLMNTLGCLDRPTSGSYLFDGKEVAKMSADGRARLRNLKIGFVFQNFNLLARTTALENVELPLLYRHDLRGSQRRQIARQLLEKVGLESRMNHHPSQLSGGQQQRAAIARALASRPSILLADEPTGNIDSRTSREVMDLFRQLNEEDGITIILVTHDQEVARHAHRTIVLRDGRVLCDSTDFASAAAALHHAEGS